MCDVIIWHGQDRNLCDRTGAALYDTGTLIKSSQFTVQISRVAFTGRNLTFRGGNLTHGFTERCDICQNDQDMHAFFKCQILCSGKCDLWCQQSFNDRVVCQVQEHDNVIRSTAFFESTAEKFCNIVFNTHSCKNDCKVFIGITAQRSLLYDLCSQLVMWKTISGKDWKFLTTDQSSQTINCRNTGIDIVSWIFSRDRIQRKTVDIKVNLRSYRTESVDRLTDTVEGTAEDFR